MDVRGVDRLTADGGDGQIDLSLGANQVEAGDRVGAEDVIYSFGIANPGAVVLHNFPRALCDFTKEVGGTGETLRIDLAAIDVTRDRERGVPRYNQFRRLLGLAPAPSFAALTANQVWAEELREVYGDVERVDPMVGMYAEPPPEGFRVWQETHGAWVTNYPPPPGFCGFEERKFGQSGYYRTLTDAERDATRRQQQAAHAEAEAARIRHFGIAEPRAGKR